MKPPVLPAALSRFHFVILVLVIAAIAIGGWRWLAGSDGPKFKLDKVEAGPLTAVVSATGTLNPVISVQIGSQVSGQIEEILADFNSPVKAGQLIARIDPETFRQRVRQAEADVDAARASLAVQHAVVAQARANLLDAERDYKRKQQLVEKKFISPAERDKAQTAFDAVTAALHVAEAQVRNGEAQIRQKQALLAQAHVDLGRTEIRSPVDGVVVKRSVDTGQTVAASLQAPELFIIARNLSDMQVETALDEADVGRIQTGQKAAFTVDAFPGRHFEGVVKQVRKAATIASNVVSYTVVISAANPDLILLPGMTANVRIIVAQKENTLKIPNAALRFRPPTGDDARRGKTAVPPAPTPGVERKREPDGPDGRVWVPDENGAPKAVVVRLGLSDGRMTEILDSELKEGSKLIIGLENGPRGKATAGAPAPRLF